MTDHTEDGAATCCDGKRNASVISELALFDSFRMAHGQALSLVGRLTALDSGARASLPHGSRPFCFWVLGTWAQRCGSLLVSFSCWVPELSGVGPGSNPGVVGSLADEDVSVSPAFPFMPRCNGRRSRTASRREGRREREGAALNRKMLSTPKVGF